MRNSQHISNLFFTFFMGLNEDLESSYQQGTSLVYQLYSDPCTPEQHLLLPHSIILQNLCHRTCHKIPGSWTHLSIVCRTGLKQTLHSFLFLIAYSKLSTDHLLTLLAVYVLVGPNIWGGNQNKPLTFSDKFAFGRGDCLFREVAG